MKEQKFNDHVDGPKGLLDALALRFGLRRQPQRIMQQVDNLASEQVRLLYKNLPTSLTISALLTLTLVSVQYSVIAPNLLFTWSAVLLTLLLIRAILFIAWKKHTHSANQADTHRWLSRFRFTTIATGIVWGIGGVLLTQSSDPSHTIYTSFTLAGLCAGAATALAIDRISAIGFLFTALLPNIIILMTEANAVSYGMSMMMILLIFFLLASARQIGIQLEENFNMRLKANENESWLRQVLENSPIATRIVDIANNQVVFANNRYIALLDSDPEEIIGVAPSSYYVHPEEYADVMEKLHKGEHVTNKLIELCSSRVNTRSKWALASYIPVEYQDKPAVLGWFYDITDRKIMEEALHDSKEQLQAILDSSPIGMGWSDLDGKVEHINNKFIELFGYTQEDIPTVEDWYQLAYPDETFRNDIVREWAHQAIIARKAGTKPPSLEAPIVCKDGSVRHIIITLSWVGNHRLVNFIDISDRWFAEQRDHARNATLEMIAKGASLECILDAIVHSVEAEDNGMLCSVLLLDNEGKHLRIGAAPNLPKFYNHITNGLEIGDGVGSCGTAAFTMRRVIVEDIQNHHYWVNFKDIAAQAGLASCWSEPIISSKGRLLGTFAIYHRQPSTPDNAALNLINYAANLASIAIEHHQADEELERQAHTDFLTELNNRRYFIQLAENELARAIRYLKPLSMFMFDIDHFKMVNDCHGHQTGDMVLTKLAETVRQALRDVDVVGRLGGEEFAVILPETNMDEAWETAERLRLAVASVAMQTEAGSTLYITISIGVATLRDIPTKVEALLKQADEALYIAKNNGRNQVRMADRPQENILADFVKLS